MTIMSESFGSKGETMRFPIQPETSETVVVRFRVPIELEAAYRKAAEEAGVDFGTALRQALSFAAGEDGGRKQTAKQIKKSKKTTDTV